MLKDIFQGVAAKVAGGAPCCDWVGSGGAGHFVKMVHNGIEYGDMQPIAEAFHIMQEILGMSADEMHEVFARWNTGQAGLISDRDYQRYPGFQRSRMARR